MRSYKNTTKFFIEMNKKPALQAILDNLDKYSIEQLESLPGQPAWIRKELIKLKQNDGDDSDQIAEMFAQQMIQASALEQEEKIHMIRQWTGSNWWLPIGKGRMLIEVNPGDLFIVLDVEKRMVKMTSSVANLTEVDWKLFLSNTKMLNPMTKKQFSEYCAEELNKKHNKTTSSVFTQTQLSTVKQPDQSFRIIRQGITYGSKK